MARSTKILGSLATLGLIMGCGSDPVPGNPADAGTGDTGTTPTDTGATPQDAGPGATYDYVINRLLLDEGAEPPATRGFYGFNLDGRTSPSTTAQQQAADCSHGDYFSVVDSDQNMGTCAAGSAGGGMGCRGGVDNQLPNVAQTIQQFQPDLDVQGTINEQISDGGFLIVVRVTDVNGTLGPTLNDPSVRVLVYPYAFANFLKSPSPSETSAADFKIDLHQRLVVVVIVIIAFVVRRLKEIVVVIFVDFVKVRLTYGEDFFGGVIARHHPGLRIEPADEDEQRQREHGEPFARDDAERHA